MNRLFEESLSPDQAASGATWSPTVDLYETDDAFVLQAELPGVEEADLDVELRPQAVQIRGHRAMPGGAGAPEHFRCLERSYGSFARSLRLASPVVVREAKRELADGVLRLELPKRTGRGEG